MTFFVFGITGNVGGAVARRLLKEGHTVRTLARNPQKTAEWAAKGVDVRKGDVNDTATLSSALQGVDGAFVMIPPVLAPSPGYPEAKTVIASYLEAFRQAPPPRLLALSSFGSEKTSGLGNITTTHLMEEAFQGLSIPVAFLRAGSFFENYVGGLGAAAATGVFYSFLQPTNRAVPMIATEDIGNEVAKLLISGWSGKKIVEIGSRVSPDQLAQAASKVLGRPVEAQAIPRERWATICESMMGMRPGTSAPYEEMMEGVNSGWIDFGAPGTEHVEGTTPAAQVFQKAQKAKATSQS